MASNSPYTLQDLQNRIHSLVENDPDTPDTDDEEWELRLNLINQAIGEWESEDTLWDQLYTTYTHGSTVGAGTTTYTLTWTNFRYLAGPIILRVSGVDTKVQVISPEESQVIQGSGEKVVWITGNDTDGYTLNLGWTPVAGDGTVGATIIIPYYKFATRFTTDSLTTAKTEVPDGNFIIYAVAATKSLMESRNNQYSVYDTQKQRCMDTMKALNEAKPYYNVNDVDDNDASAWGAIIGE